MNERLESLLEKLRRRQGASVPDLAAKALTLAGETAAAAVALRACDTVGRGARAIGGRPIIRNEGQIQIGKDLGITSRWMPAELTTGPEGKITIGDDAQINFGTLVSARKRVTIGDRVMIGNHCIVADTELPGTPPVGDDTPREVVIGDDVWLAVRVTVLPGSRIGAGAIVTAGSVVSGEIPPGVVAGGIPARVLRGGQQGREPRPVSTNEGTKPREVAHRGTILSDFTASELASQLRALTDGPGIDAEVAPFGQVVQSLVRGPTPGYDDFAVVWTRPEAAVPTYARVIGHERVEESALLDEVDAFCDLLARAAPAYRAIFVPTWTKPAYERGSGLLDMREGGLSRTLHVMNGRLMERLASAPDVHVLDASRWLAHAGKSRTSPKSWYLGKISFHVDVFAEAARDIQGALDAVSGRTRKLLVLDLDDTLWGGVVGDVGWENLRLGGHDGLGESFVDFQRAVKGLTRRGIVLALVSKNEESTALEALRRHPEMVLREDDFVAWRINWRDKAANILEIVKELNLGLQSVVFVDDNPVERARVREALPEVLVPEWPEDKYLYRSALAALRCFDVASITKEDAERTALYAAERKRERLQQTVGSIDEWLEGLGIRVSVEPLAAHNLQRTAQLLNKTNQLNLSTRRMTETELLEWSLAPNRRLWAASVSDRFGDAGLTGIVSVELDGERATIVDFVLSCRVMGRKVEAAMVHVAIGHARTAGAKRVDAKYLETAKNKPTLDFWRASGFTADGDLFSWDTSTPFELPRAITLETP